ncbi:MAG: bifunctional (p)ppGpp synthetase/guanosine-3',5'-bis(diphosphate) 3'-pyrophosphohydrolase [Leptospiraceae bacterium]|nr:bifunctional (p)ppGpp synthetase/guanosine-3',5'-bis(diphosphate) 3'-pyrophosphohydrolase [Leptospiraceae bacterium]MCP5510325.1 bifunctional (p)ppGpp synthetase/guanosine-3',5'-bis(diphosphate) 3'-pyrophosphohydrolase [Leptospiraceae bacterium]
MPANEVTIDEFLKDAKAALSKKSYDLVMKAFEISNKYHEGQKRLSGQPYVIHPVNVAHIIMHDLNGQDKIIAAALLHDVVEDTPYTHEDMENNFGPEIANMVKGVTKVSEIKNKSKENILLENVKRILMATIQDPRVIIIKLADKTHNMRTLGFQPHEKQIRIANEVMNIYAPIASRMGVYKIKSELEDLAFQVLEPESYQKIKEMVASKKTERDLHIEEIKERLMGWLNQGKIKAIIEGRSKHFYSIHKKLKEKDRKLEEIYDLRALRIITKEIQDCYAILGISHTHFTPVPGRFKDYIATPKSNLYQSLHTTIISTDGRPIELQIRTEEMNSTAESGIAAHWGYKEGKYSSLEQKFIDRWKEQMRFFAENPTADMNDFMSDFSNEMRDDEIIAFTPRGDMLDFPRGATVLDFAFRVHTDVGLHTKAGKVNGKIVPIRTPLRTGDQVEIITEKNAKPSPIWERILKTPHARQKLRQYFRKIQDDLKSQTDGEYVRSGPSSNIAISDKDIANIRKTNKKSERKDKQKENISIVVGGYKDILVRIANCCSPIPGDEIIGFITRGRGVSVHKKTCELANSFTDEKRIVNVRWDGVNKPVPVRIEVKAYDRPRIYLEIVDSITKTDTNIIEAGASSTGQGTMIARFQLEIEHLDQFEEIIENIKSIQNIIQVERILNA